MRSPGTKALLKATARRYVCFVKTVPSDEARAASDAWDVDGERVKVLSSGDILVELTVPTHQARVGNTRLERLAGTAATMRDLKVVNAIDDKWGCVMEEQEQTGGTGLGYRSVSVRRAAQGSYAVTNARGGQLTIDEGQGTNFTSVELLLAAIAGCTSIDVDYITSRRAEPTTFEVVAAGEKVKDDQGNRLADLTLTFTVRFPDGANGDKAREMLPRALHMSHERLCTVSRTVSLGTPGRNGARLS